MLYLSKKVFLSLTLKFKTAVPVLKNCSTGTQELQY